MSKLVIAVFISSGSSVDMSSRAAVYLIHKLCLKGVKTMDRFAMLPAPIFKLLAERDQGILSSLALERAIVKARAEQLALNPRRHTEFCHDSSILCMDMDKAEDRYLLCGYVNGAIGILDVEDTASRMKHIFGVVLRIEPGQHKFGISGVAWNPLDTGMFVSSSFDKTIKVHFIGPVPAGCSV